MNDKEIFYQILSREIDNLIVSFNNPLLNMFSEPAKHYVVRLIDPYISAFIEPPKNELNVDMASAFLKEEASEKIDNFKNKFNKMKDFYQDPYAD